MLEFGNVGFCGGKKTGVHKEKHSERGQNLGGTQPKKLWHNTRFELGPNWWKVGTLITAPSLLQYTINTFLQ